MKVFDVISNELGSYFDVAQEIAPGVTFSESKLKKRITLYKNRHYPKGKFTKLGEYKYWPDIIAPLVEANVKNLRFTVKNILAFSRNPVGDFAAVFTINAAMEDWMLKNGRAEELAEAIEQFSADGNVLFKRVKGGYSLSSFEDTYIINQAARTVDETPIIERYQLTQSQIRAKADVWKNTDKVIEDCGDRFFRKTLKSSQKDTTNPIYEVFERNGEMSEKALFEAQGVPDSENKGDPNKFILCRVIVAGLTKGSTDKRYVLFAESLSGKMSEYFIEAHRGAYKGRWWREGLYELLFDHQYRACEIAVQIARATDWTSKVVFRSNDTRTVQNIRVDVANGDIIKSGDLTQLDLRSHGLDQLIADWNRNLDDARRIANALEVVQGEASGANMPFALGQLLDQNASKLFVFLRQKLGTAYARVFKEFLLPQLVKDLRVQDVIELVGDEQLFERFRNLIVEDWYVRNLIYIGPHTPEIAKALKAQKLQELGKVKPLIQNMREMWDGILRRILITVTGENYETSEQLQTIAATLQFEQDPVRRAFLLDTVYAAKGIPVPPAVNAAVMADQAGASSAPVGDRGKALQKITPAETVAA